MTGEPDEHRHRLYRLLPARLATWIAGQTDGELAAEAGGDLLLADAERLVGLVKAKVEMSAWSELGGRLTALEAAR